MSITVKFSAQACAFASAAISTNPENPKFLGVQVRRPTDPQTPGLVLTGSDRKVVIGVHDALADVGDLEPGDCFTIGLDKKKYPGGAEVLKHCRGTDPRRIVVEFGDDGERAACSVVEVLEGGTENPVYIAPAGIPIIEDDMPDLSRVIPRSVPDSPMDVVGGLDVQNLARVLAAASRVTLSSDGEWLTARSTTGTQAVTLYGAPGTPVGMRWDVFGTAAFAVILAQQALAVWPQADDTGWF